MIWSASFDDLQEGARFETRGRTITEADVVSFAALTGDWHPQHADAEWARSSAFGERIAHGMLVVSFAVGLVPLDPERVIALRRVRDAVFRRPVRLGDTIHARGRVAALKPAGYDAGLVTLAIDVLRQDGRRACAAQVEVLWSGDGVPSAETEADARPCGEMVWGAA